MASFSSKHGVDDMVMLTSVNENSILDNLKKRHANDAIYTYIGHVLISVNPYKMIKPLYTDQCLKDYRGKYRYELPPHVYSLADDMYRSMMSEGENQCVIISGESGAGKTEASKRVMQYIAAVSGNNPEVIRVKNIILESNPLLEAFGNAKTLRNNNSSRFGKYMEIQFDFKGDPEGGRVTNYLLEKSRVIYQTEGERNFHIFYQILSGADARQREELGIQGPEYFDYLNQGKCYTVEGINDSQEFQDTLKAMTAVGISEAEKNEILRICIAILYLGNITFTEDEKEQAQISDGETLNWFSHLLQCEPNAVRQALCYRTISSGSKRASTYACPQNAAGAYYSRDALAKAIYSRMFDWIVMKINEGLSVNDPDSFTIGVLDIYGFEIFQKNGFEQLCINYVNEKLQQIFIQLTLKAEQDEYAAEGIKWEPIEFFNNQICCDLIESKKNPIGVIAQLDDVCNFPKGTDDKLLQKLGEAFMNHAHFSMGGRDEFVIKHYAGDVSYNVEGFCDKNRDMLFNDLIDLATCTKSALYPQFFPESRQAADKRRPSSAGTKIKESIGLLVKALSACKPHYIRCMKPNERKRANDFDDHLMMHQVRYLGLLENVRVRRAGYAYRHFYENFFYRYRVCCDRTFPDFNGSIQQGVDLILESLHLKPNEFSKGKTKIFIRQPETVFNLEELRERKVYSYANKIQRFFLRFALRRYFWEVQMAGNDLLQAKKQRRRLSLERPFHGDYIGYRENFPLKDIVKSAGSGNEKVVFADNANKYDRRSRKQRRVILVSEQALYIIAVEKNKDKDKIQKKKKPWVYMLKRRTEVSRINSAVLSTFADNFVLFVVPGEHDNLIECRRKTELIAHIKRLNPSFSSSISDTMSLTIKGGKKRAMGAVADASAGIGKLKGKKIAAPSGLPAGTKPNIPEPRVMETQAIAPPQREAIQRKAGAPRPGIGGSTSASTVSSRPTPGGASRPTPGGASGGARPSPPSAGPPPSVAPPGRGGISSRGSVAPATVSPVSRGASTAPSRGAAPPSRGAAAPPTRGGATAGRGGAVPPPAGRGAPTPSRGGTGATRGGRGGGAVGGGKSEQYRALYDFEAENPDELNFREGDVISLIEKVEADWWKGSLNGTVGLFPVVYVEKV